jgi:hypothetical protein
MSNRIYRLGTNWSNLNKIKFTLTLDDVTWIIAKAVAFLWTKGKVQYRTCERKSIQKFINILNEKISEHKNQFLKFILNYPKNTVFSRILLPINQY